MNKSVRKDEVVPLMLRRQQLTVLRALLRHASENPMLSDEQRLYLAVIMNALSVEDTGDE